jgi:hypothetical protein
MQVMIAKKVLLRSRRFLEQQRQEGAFGQPQRQPSRQCQRQPGLSFLPELDEQYVADTMLTIGQTLHLARFGQFPVDKPQARSSGRQVRRSNQAESSSGCRFFFFAELVHT